MPRKLEKNLPQKRANQKERWHPAALPVTPAATLGPSPTLLFLRRTRLVRHRLSREHHGTFQDEEGEPGRRVGNKLWWSPRSSSADNCSREQH